MNELKQMTDETLTRFQSSGVITVCGHELTTDEVCLKYAFDSDVQDTIHHYEAHSNGDVSKYGPKTPRENCLKLSMFVVGDSSGRVSLKILRNVGVNAQNSKNRN